MDSYSYIKAVRLKNIISDEFVKGLNVSCDEVDLKVNYGFDRHARYVRLIFAAGCHEIVTQCMERNVVYNSAERLRFKISIEEKTKVDVDRILKIGKIYTDVNLLDSDFKFYEFRFYSFKYKRYVGLRISYRIYKELVKKVNAGKRYGRKKSGILTTKEVVELIAPRFKKMPKQKIEIILREGFSNIHNHVGKATDVLIENKYIPFKLLFYKPNFEIRKKWASNQKTLLQEAS